MARISEVLTLDMVLDLSRYNSALTEAERRGRRFSNSVAATGRRAQNQLGGAFDRIKARGASSFTSLTRGLRGVGRAITSIQGLIVGGGLALVARDFSNAAARFEEAEAKFNAVFKDFSITQRQRVEDFSRSIGRSVVDLIEFQSTLQDTLVPLGVARGEAADLSDAVTRLAIDVASFNNRLDADVVRDFQSALVGNTETVRKYGIVINQTTLDQELLNRGVTAGVRGATEAEKALARLAIIQRQSADAIGNAAREADGFTGTMRRIQAVLTDVRVELGQRINQAILQIIERFGGAEGIARAFGQALTFVGSVAETAITVIGSLARNLFGFTSEVEDAERAALRFSIIMKRGEVAALTFSGILQGLAGSLALLVVNAFGVGRAFRAVFVTIFGSVAAAVSKFVDFIVSKLADLIRAVGFVASEIPGISGLGDSLLVAGDKIAAFGRRVGDFGEKAFAKVGEEVDQTLASLENLKSVNLGIIENLFKKPIEDIDRAADGVAELLLRLEELERVDIDLGKRINGTVPDNPRNTVPGFQHGITGVPRSFGTDSVLARLTPGESVINRRGTELFAPLISAINEIGRGSSPAPPSAAMGTVIHVGGIHVTASGVGSVSEEIGVEVAEVLNRLLARGEVELRGSR